MLIFNNEATAVLLDSIFDPVEADYFWVLDLKMMDFTLAPLMVLEEISCPTIMVRIDDYTFALPATWNILVFDPETHQLDVVEVKDLAGKEFVALKYGPNMKTHQGSVISVVDYLPNHVNIGPSLAKYQMLCHPISPDSWVNVSPSDVYTKYLKELAVGDII